MKRRTTYKVEGTIDSDTVKAALTSILPDDVRYRGEIKFSVRVPGGGDYSYCDLTDFEVEWTAEWTHEDE